MGKTLKEAQQHLRNNWVTGTNCECCGQFVKLYKRKLNSGMALTLIRIYNHYPYDQVDVKEFLRQNKYKNNHDWTLLKHWGLLREVLEYNKVSEAKHNGKWMITRRGVDFILYGLPVESHILIYNNKFQGYSDEKIDIVGALGSKFNYKELMNA
jgi:hypothetical protein